MSPILGIWASQNYSRITPSYDSIATVTIGAGGASSATFSSIPSTYKHLQIRVFASPTDANVFMRLNGDAVGNTNYARHFLYGDGSAAASGGVFDDVNLSVGFYSTTSGIFGASVVDILDYQNTNKYKTTRGLSAGDANGSGLAVLYSGLRKSTDAITSISLYSGSAGTFRQYSSFALYGIRG